MTLPLGSLRSQYPFAALKENLRGFLHDRGLPLRLPGHVGRFIACRTSRPLRTRRRKDVSALALIPFTFRDFAGTDPIDSLRFHPFDEAASIRGSGPWCSGPLALE